MLLGLILGTVYFVLVLLGFDGNRNENKTRKKSEDKLVSLTKTTKDITEEKQVQTAEEKPGFVERQRKELQEHKSDSRKQIGEATFSSCPRTSCAIKSQDELKLAPDGSEKVEKLEDEQKLEAVEIEDVLQGQDALYLQEFNVTDDFITERQKVRARSHGSIDSSELSSETINKIGSLGSSEEKETELTVTVTEAVSSSVSSVPAEQRFDDIALHDNEQPAESNIDVLEFNSSADFKESGLFGDFAELLVTRAKEGALDDIGLESKANAYAQNISMQIVSDAIGQFAASSISDPEEHESSNVQELHSFAENVVDSLMEVASGKVSLVKDVESFAKDMSEQVINEGVEHYTTAEKLKQGRKQKLSLNEMKIFSEGIVSEVVSEGIEQAVQEDINIKESNAGNKNLSELEHEGLSQQTMTLPSSIQPHICGIVENLVNGAIYEAALRAKAHSSEPSLEESELEGCAQDILESQVDETVQELIVSALHQAADLKEQEGKLESESSRGDKSELESRLGSFVDGALDAAVNEAAGKVLNEQSISDQESKVLNGHVDLSLEPNREKSYQGSPAIVVRSADGVDLVPSKENEEMLELSEKGTSDSSDYWRQSLVLDLEEDDEEFDESFESEKSHPSTGDSPLTPNEKETVSEEDESEEFVDSSEDEVIDHAEDAKLGAVGGSSVKKYESDDEDDEMIFGDELDDDNDEEDLLFAGQSMVDGLCASKPKEKRKSKKSKKKSLPRPRIQSAGSHYNKAVVIDNGSGIIKLGLAGGKTPTVVQPALYGTPKRYSLQMAGMDNKNTRKYGNAATSRAGVMQLEYPMSGGFLENWSDVEDIWEYMLYEELGIEEGNHPVLVTEVANTPKRKREKMAEILFEHLGVPALYLANQLVLSLYASGLTMGMCLSSGFSVTQAAAIYEGHILQYTVQELDIAGKSLTDNLQKLLRENKGHNFNSSSGWQIVNNMKESMAYVSQDYSSEMKEFKTRDALTQFYSLPDGQAVEISSEMISTPEPLFNPETLLGADDTIASQPPMHKLVNNAFKRCSPDLQDNIYRNIVLSGGTTFIRGLVPRLQYELGKINPKIRSVRAPDNRMFSAWIGGSILGSLSTLENMYATIDEYADYGGRIVNQKCF